MEVLAVGFVQCRALQAILAHTMMMLLGEEATFIAPGSLSDASLETPMPKLTHRAEAFGSL